MSQFKSKLCGFTLGLRVRSKTLNASRAARCIRLSRDGFRVAQVSAHVFLEVLVKNVVNTDANRPADMSPRCATRRQPTRDADEWWCDDGARYLRTSDFTEFRVPCLVHELHQLRGFAAARLALDNNNAVLSHSSQNGVLTSEYGQSLSLLRH